MGEQQCSVVVCIDYDGTFSIDVEVCSLLFHHLLFHQQFLTQVLPPLLPSHPLDVGLYQQAARLATGGVDVSVDGTQPALSPLAGSLLESSVVADTTSCYVRVSLATPSSGSLAFRIGSPTGPLIASLPVRSTGGYGTYGDRVAALSPFCCGPQDLFVVSSNEGLCNISGIELVGKAGGSGWWL